jgi:selenide, water dikinase
MINKYKSNVNTDSIKLTQYSHGAGCGCKISPRILDKILASQIEIPCDGKLIVGNHTRDDAAVYDLDNGIGLISTTDFFMPIVDDPFDFGRIASANAISDVYAMGGRPLMAIAILGWPVDKIDPEIAQHVLDGAKTVCSEIGIPLAGGHSIDSPEPIFGLAVSGMVSLANLKKNNTAMEGDLIFLTKPIGVGILTTAEKKGILDDTHKGLAAAQMMQLNSVGEKLGTVERVHALTDVTGFGLLGHLVEMAEGSGLSAEIIANEVPLITNEIPKYIQMNCIPGGTKRNWESYGEKIGPIADLDKTIMTDPQTSGGLLIAVPPDGLSVVKELLINSGLEKFVTPIGVFTKKKEKVVYVKR